MFWFVLSVSDTLFSDFEIVGVKFYADEVAVGVDASDAR